MQKQPIMYQVLSKDMIEMEIVPYLPETKRDFKPKAPLYETINTTTIQTKNRCSMGLFAS
ncbi:hypothetical protein [Changchengzhania lutea]|uniref:hypothetical protein n=1 Tax=Changchengzhania lutea TaxID=2049305 RepID=UPI00115CB5C7|nr:hypothetical protein [Changchengzhania lutea]